MQGNENKFKGRVSLVEVSGVLSSYKDRQGKYMDISALSGACYLTPDARDALYLLNERVQQASGSLHVTEAYRSWETQAKAYEDWLEGKRKSYVAPPGRSFHEAGRAIDIDVNALNFSGTEQKYQLSKFWTIASSCGWRPIVKVPNSNLSECWHFEYPGKPWSARYGTQSNGHIAMMACLDAGHWNPLVSQETFTLFFVESQLNRLLLCNVKVQLNEDWRKYLQYVNLPEDISVQEAADRLRMM